MKNLLHCACLGAFLTTGLFAAGTSSARETPTWFSSSYWVYASAKGVAGAVEPVRVDGKSALRVRYEFTPESGRYAGAYIWLQTDEAFVELRFSVKSDTGGNVLVRLFDTDDEVLQYTVPVKASADWADVRLEVARPTATFAVAGKKGVILNKKADFPLTGLFFGLEVPKGVAARGNVLFTDPELVR